MVLLSLPIVPVPVEYREVPGWSGYRVGSDGSVWSCKVSKTLGRGRRLVTLGESWHRLIGGVRMGYQYVMLCKDGTQRKFRVHSLVLILFVGPRPAGMEACHYNGDRLDNRLINLRWDTKLKNAADTKRLGRYLRGERQPNSRLTEADVLKIRELVASGTPKRTVAKQFGVSDTLVRKIFTREAWSWLQVEGS